MKEFAFILPALLVASMAFMPHLAEAHNTNPYNYNNNYQTNTGVLGSVGSALFGTPNTYNTSYTGYNRPGRRVGWQNNKHYRNDRSRGHDRDGCRHDRH